MRRLLKCMREVFLGKFIKLEKVKNYMKKKVKDTDRKKRINSSVVFISIVIIVLFAALYLGLRPDVQLSPELAGLPQDVVTTLCAGGTLEYSPEASGPSQAQMDEARRVLTDIGGCGGTSPSPSPTSTSSPTESPTTSGTESYYG